jgi:hypothetical protein
MNRQIMECNFLDDTAQEDVCAMGNYLRNKYTEGIFKTMMTSFHNEGYVPCCVVCPACLPDSDITIRLLLLSVCDHSFLLCIPGSSRSTTSYSVLPHLSGFNSGPQGREQTQAGPIQVLS